MFFELFSYLFVSNRPDEQIRFLNIYTNLKLYIFLKQI